MLSSTTLEKVGNLIRAIADSEAKVENARQALCEKSHFELYTAFNRVSCLSSTITSQHLLKFLKKNEVTLNRQDAYYLIRLYDTNGDGKLSYSEFVNVVLTRTYPALRKEVTNRKSYPVKGDEGLPSYVEFGIARVFEEELDAHRRCEVLKQELVLSEDFDMMSVFQEIDIQNEGFIDGEKIAKFMELIEDSLNNAQVDAFMSRADRKGTGAIKYREFLELFHSAEIGYAEEKIETSPTRTVNTLITESRYHDTRRDSYSSPSKGYLSPLKMLSTTESFYSPTSTKASMNMANSLVSSASAIFRTPTKPTPVKAVHEDFMEVSQPVEQLARKQSSPHFTVNFSPRRESPMRPKDELQLVKGLKEMIEHIHALEGLKNGLAMRPDFSTYNAFAVFDVEKKGYVNTRQLEQGFQNLNIHVTKSDITLLMKRLDTDLDGAVRFEDFSQIITPKTAEFAKLTFSKKPRFVSNLQSAIEAFDEDTLGAYKTFLVALIEGETLCESIRQRLAKRKSFNLHDAFKALDRYDNGFITAEQFKDILADNELFFSQKDCNTLVERYAKSEKGKVSYYEFVKEMTPKSVENY